MVVRYVQNLLADGDADATTRYRQATQNLLFADGRQHIDWSLKDKAWKDAPSSDGRIRVTMNYIRPILRSRAQRLLSSKISWAAIPRSNAHEERDRATLATNLLTARWDQTDMDAKVRRAQFLADCCGVAYLKQFWNPSDGPLTQATITAPHPQTGLPTTYPVDADGQALHDDQGNPLEGADLGFTYRPGDTDTAVRTIFNVRVNPDAEGLETADGFRWLLDASVLPISVVKERWGDRAKNVQSTQGVAQMRQYEAIVRSVAGRPTSSNDLLTGRNGQRIPDKDVALYVEYWEAATEATPGGRLIVIAGEELLFDGPLPQGLVPFAPVYSERRPLDAYGRPFVNDLIAPQKVINTQWGAILEEQQVSGVGQWAMFDVPGLSDQLSNLTAAHVKIPMASAVANRSIGDLIQRINPAVSSPDRWRLLEAAQRVMFDIGAFHEIQRGQVPPGVDSGVAVQLLQEAENGQMHDSVRELQHSFVLWGRQTGAIAKWGYGPHEERWIPQQRPDLGYLVESVTGEDLPDFETLDLDLEGFKPHSQAAFAAEIKDAMEKGWMDPRQGMKLLDLGRGVEGAFDSQNRHYSRARRENLAIQQKQYQVQPSPPGSVQEALGVLGVFLYPDGGSFLLPQDDDHLIHIDVHQEIFLDDTRPLPERQAAGMHIAEHRAVLQQTLMAQQSAAQTQDNPQDAKSTTPPSPSQGTSAS